jgi:hypothetical protein
VTQGAQGEAQFLLACVENAVRLRYNRASAKHSKGCPSYFRRLLDQPLSKLGYAPVLKQLALFVLTCLQLEKMAQGHTLISCSTCLETSALLESVP